MLKSLIVLAFMLCALPVTATQPPAEKASDGEITGKVVSIADGDTLTILTAEKKQVKIRLNGIDAPERGQAFGTKSKEMLSHIIGKSDVRVETHGEDRYGRTIGVVFVRTPNSAASDPEANLNFMMVANGYAWHYVRYAPDNKQLADAEKHAREKKLGLWADASPVAPWDWRKQEADKKKAGK
jgi:micrococcal nuclease